MVNWSFPFLSSVSCLSTSQKLYYRQLAPRGQEGLGGRREGWVDFLLSNLLIKIKSITKGTMGCLFTSSQKFYNKVFLLVGLTTLGLLLNIDWLGYLVECPKVLTSKCNLKKGLFCLSSIYHPLFYPFRSLRSQIYTYFNRIKYLEYIH